MPSVLGATVEHYLMEWGSPGWAHAFHSLIELGPDALPFLVARFDRTGDAGLRAELTEIAHRQRAMEALPLLTRALDDSDPRVWKAALDGLVGLATADAIRILENALSRSSPSGKEPADFRSWVEEALGQAREAAHRANESAS